jgi:hypothetical protein
MLGQVGESEAIADQRNTCVPLVHIPLVVDRIPKVVGVAPHVVLGLPAQPSLQVALHTVPVVLLDRQLYTPFRGLTGLPVHTAKVAAAVQCNTKHPAVS